MSVDRHSLYQNRYVLSILNRTGGEPWVLAKEPADRHATSASIEQLDNEHDITSRLAHVSGVRRVLGREGRERHPRLLLEYIPGETLADLIRDSRLNLREKLYIAREIAAILDEVHGAHVVHRDISSSNILVGEDFNHETGNLFLIDFGLAIETMDTAPERPVGADDLVGTLAYIAPEQTGRVNRPVDHRADLYSLGAVLYELFTGRLPFETDDALEMTHAHIARTPVPPLDFDAEIPLPISEIILRLLAKHGDDRYQTAHGLHADLAHCLEQVEVSGTVEPFLVGRNDTSGRLKIPDKLYGRQSERRQLLGALTRAIDVQGEFFLVAGEAGVGKTALVQELYEAVSIKGGICIEGKFDQYNRDIAYSAWVEAFIQLTSYWLTQDERIIRRLRSDIQRALGNSSQALIELLPSLEQIIDLQPAAPSLEGKAAERRLDYLFHRLVSTVVSPAQPLAIFLDDLQWADLDSINLLVHLLSTAQIKGLLVIGAYRQDEVDSTHPLPSALRQLSNVGVNVHRLILSNLSQDDVTAMVSESLNIPRSRSESLAEILHRRAHGNPFFTRQLLLTIEEENLLLFDGENRTWHWHTEELQRLAAADNVVDLMLKKIHRLPKETQRFLQIAACLGNQFEFTDIVLVSGGSLASVYTWLDIAIDEGLLAELNGTGSFSHDRIHQAAYMLANDNQRTQLHREIGYALLHSTPHARRRALTDIVGHLNRAVSLVQNDADRIELITLNARAAQDSKDALAFAAANQFASCAMNLLVSSDWQSRYQLTLKVHQVAAETAFLVKDFEAGLQLAEALLAQAQMPLHRQPAIIAKLRIHQARGEYQAVMETGRAGLQDLGFQIHESMPPDLAPSAIANLPQLRDPSAAAALEILESMTASAYIYDKRWWFPSTLFTALKIMLEHGVGPASSEIVAWFAASTQTQDIVDGYRYGNVAMSLVDRLDAKRYRGVVASILIGFVWFRIVHFRRLEEEVAVALQLNREMGNSFFTASCYNKLCFFACLSGQPLDKVAERLHQLIELQQRTSESFAPETLQIWSQFVENLRGLNSDPLILEGRHSAEIRDSSAQRATRLSMAPVFDAPYLQLVLHYHLGEYPSAVAYALEAEPKDWTNFSHIAVSSLAMYQSLAILQLVDSQQAYPDLFAKVDINITKLRLLAKYGPTNYQHKLDLVRAEMARIQGDFAGAIEKYTAAIQGAKENEFLQEEALANELFGRFWLQHEYVEGARNHIIDAHALYERWGAISIVGYLVRQYPEWLGGSLEITGIRSMGSISRPLDDLDLHSVLKASNAIATELALDRLLGTVMRIVMENAGAQRGYLLLQTGEQWEIAATSALDQNNPQPRQTVPIEDDDLLARNVVNYVANRHKPMILDDAASDDAFLHDPYIQRNQTKSLLCMPLINQGTISAILYLENNLATHVFAEERLTLLNLLSSQMAISIDHARLYDHLEEEVEARTRDLTTLLDSASSITTAIDSASLFEVLLDHLGRVVDYRSAFIWIREEDTLVLRAGRCSDPVETDLGKRIDILSSPVLREAIEAQEVIALDDTTGSWHSVLPLLGISGLRSELVAPRSWLGAPLVAQGETTGLIILVDEKREYYTPQRCSIVKAFAFQAAVAIENVRLYDEVQQTSILKERDRLARELHDAVSQTIFSASMIAEAVPDLWQRDRELGSQYLQKLPPLLRGALAELRTLLLELRPSALKDQTLAQLLELLASAFQTRSAAEVNLDLTEEGTLAEDVKLTFHRIVQESFSNVTKHADASQIDVWMQSHADSVELRLVDNGKGFDPESVRPGSLGLGIMRDRAAEIGADLKIDSRPGAGTTVTILWSASPRLVE